MAGYDRDHRRAQRREGKHQRLGSPDPKCLNCGLLDVEALMAVSAGRLPRRLLEEHHLAGRRASSFTVTLCRNCHAVLTDWQEDWDGRLRRPATEDERLAALLQGLADWLWALARSLAEVAARSEAYVRWLLEGKKGPAPAFRDRHEDD